MRWGRTALCSLAVVAPVLLGTASAAAAQSSGASAVLARAATNAAPLTLVSQTASVTPTQPWFNVSVGVGSSAGSASGLHVTMTFYSRLDSESQLQQAISGSPGGNVLRRSDVSVTNTNGALTATACVTVLPNGRATPPGSGVGACAPGSDTVTLGCTPSTGTCGDVYPVSVALFHNGSSTPIARMTTFLTYEEQGPGAVGAGGPLRVGIVLPVSDRNAGTVATALSAHREVPTTLAVDPSGIARLEQTSPKKAARAVQQLASLSGDELIDQPYVPIDLAELSEADLSGEIAAQLARGDDVLHAAGLKPANGPWVDTISSFSQGDSGVLATGLQKAGASQLVLDDGDLASGGLSNYTFAQPFTLDLGHGANVTAVVSNSALSARFTGNRADPVLGAEQLLAGLSFVHFENASLAQGRGIVVTPPPSWHATEPFLDTLLAGLSDNQALTPLTLTDLFAQVPVGGNHEPATRRLQSGPATRGISHSAAVKIAQARQQLSSFTAAVAVKGQAPAQLVTLSDALLATEASPLSAPHRAAAVLAYQHAFADQTGKIGLAGQETVTFTAQQASIPITVLSSAPYPVKVVVTLTSDKFTFPDGNTQTLTLDRPTTSVRMTAQARTSGDRLPIDVSLHTQNGQLLLARTVLTVHSTAISFVGVALTVLAGAVLLVWWARTWRRARRGRPRAH